jgi:TIR domain
MSSDIHHGSDVSNFSGYDLALSFAGEDRSVAEELATALQAKGYRIFYDRFEQAKLIGEDLTAVLGQIYAKGSRYCLILISKSYVAKPWTNQERQFALSRALKERSAYILPLKLDDTDLPGLSPTIGYLDIRNTSVPEVCTLLAQKMGLPSAAAQSDASSSAVSEASIRKVLSVCYRRAIFTRYHAQMIHESMFASLADCRVSLQKLVTCVTPAECQQLVAGIIGELDLIERVNSVGFTWNGSGTAAAIDGSKLRIIHALLELASRAKLPLEFPKTLTEELIFSQEEASSPPAGPETWEGSIGGCGGFKG